MIFAVAPASMGSRLQTGVVQPQEAWTLSSFNGVEPVFTISNVVVAGRPCGILPKLWLFSFTWSTSAGRGRAVPAVFTAWALTPGARRIPVVKRLIAIANFFIVWLR